MNNTSGPFQSQSQMSSILSCICVLILIISAIYYFFFQSKSNNITPTKPTPPKIGGFFSIGE